MHVAIDAERCQGHARCWELCPEVFTLDEVGHGTVLVPDVPDSLEESVAKAAANCPERAIVVS